MNNNKTERTIRLLKLINYNSQININNLCLKYFKQDNFEKIDDDDFKSIKQHLSFLKVDRYLIVNDNYEYSLTEEGKQFLELEEEKEFLRKNKPQLNDVVSKPTITSSKTTEIKSDVIAKKEPKTEKVDSSFINNVENEKKQVYIGSVIGNSCNSITAITNITDIPLLQLLPLLYNKKDIVLSYIQYYHTISEIANKSNIIIQTVSNIIHNETRHNGLLDDGLIEMLDSTPKEYYITKSGTEYLNSIILRHYKTKEEHDKQKAHEQTLINEINDLKGVFLEKYNYIIEQTINKGKKWVGFEFKDIARWNYEFSERLLENPNDTLKQIEIAIESVHGKKIEARIKNLPKSQTIKIGDIRIEHLNKMFYFDGVIKQTSQVKPLVTMTTHSCPVCGEECVIMQVEHKLIEPSKCACGYKGKQIQKNKSMVDLQVLKLEELPEELCGRTNCQSVSVILKGTLAKSKLQQYYNPGSRIRINGIVKETPIIGKTGSKDVKMNLIIEANYVEPQEKTFTFNPTADELVKIKELSKRKDLMPLLARSFIPTLKDMTDVKIGAMLAIVKGGNAKRDEIHMLICGEPGLAKSEILTYIAKTLPFARYANGASSSSVGLTASVIKDEFTGTWSLNAGTVVMANEGICCVDEIDKMRDEDKNDLNEAAEQGTVTINKAGISGSLQAKTSMIMASNPKNHKFSDDIPYMEQINLPYALLTRFDLLFILRNTDEAMLELFDKILDETTSTLEYLEEDLILKYLLYARKLTPKLCPESVKIIKHKMRGVVEFRKLDTGGFPLSVRQLQGMVRLSTAFAKMRLSEVVEECDVNSAWDLYVSATKTVIHESADILNSKVN